ncbi:hypothetical protein OAJ75_02645 [Candidatus Pelagibacter sp.]|nr:hypothetical protein [Candidatus Pelagibacter sp.]
MRQYIYKMLIFIISIILIYEFTIGKQVSQFSSKIESISSKEGRKDSINKIREEIKKGINKERYLSKEDAKLINDFLNKIKKELNEVNR